MNARLRCRLRELLDYSRRRAQNLPLRHLSMGMTHDFEVAIEDEDTITLRRISTPANCGLVGLLLECPAPFEVPTRDRDDTEPPPL